MYDRSGCLRTRVGHVVHESCGIRVEWALKKYAVAPFFDDKPLKLQTSTRKTQVSQQAATASPCAAARSMPTRSALPALGVAGLLAVLLSGSDALAKDAEPEVLSGLGHVQQSEKRWRTDRIIVTFDRSLDRLENGSWAAQVAFGTWLEQSRGLPELTFAEGSGITPSLKPDGKNAVMWARIPFEGHENDLAITIVFSDPKTNEIIESDIILNDRQPLAVLSDAEAQEDGLAASSCTGISLGEHCGGRYDLMSVAMHEVGHFFGLSENTQDQRAAMFQCANPCEVHKRELSAQDLSDIDDRYNSAVGQAPSQRSGCQLTGGRPKRGGASFGLAALLGLVRAVRRRRSGAASRKARRGGAAPKFDSGKA